MKAPTFLIIGAQKAATTSLQVYLARHPDVSMSAPKELHYFDRVDGYPDHAWYRGMFRLEERTRAAGEATPIYCFWPGAIQRIWEFDPTLKLIMSVRNPIDRAVSQYWMEYQNGTEHLPLAEALTREADRTEPFTSAFELRRWTYLSRGRYVEHIDQIYQYFPPTQLLVIRFEDLLVEPSVTLRQVTDFIGVGPSDDIPFTRELARTYPPVEASIREHVRSYYVPYNESLTAKYGIRTDDWI